ncbi:alpha/beta fold hydrolase [Achromobacter sp. DH1f]|uniref:alpha/beta fold hydrolase n=1 Tax=Achromobacter sp. DH1f TaxID=1397275 RepID=UPI0004685EE2|nr:alpha/beta hydrolase [Achromobacter sp. DH1f]
MPDTASQRIATTPDLTFDVSVGGPPDRPLVMLLHGFGVSRHSYDAQVAALADAGLHAAAPNQRGYSPQARPDPAVFSHYRMDNVIQDVFDIAAALGHGDQRFHLVGHDWGASVAWEIADRHPERLASLTILSRPHPLSFNRALAQDAEQAGRSGHHGRFLDPQAGPDILADDAKWLRSRLTRNGVPQSAIDTHLTVLGNPAAMEAALAWYRARGTRHAPVGRTVVPTLYIWGNADDTVGRAAATGTGEFVDAPYEFIELPGVGHFVADQAPEAVTAALLAHLARHPA